MSVLPELYAFSRDHDKRWLLPIFILLLLGGRILTVKSRTAVSPLIYPIF